MRYGENVRLLLKMAKVQKPDGRLPRIHDFRHSFAVNAMLRWYRSGVEVQSKLPFLSAYMGHVSIASTHYYLHFYRTARLPRQRTICRSLRSLGDSPAKRKGGFSMKSKYPNELALALRDFFGEFLPKVKGTSPHTLAS